VNLAQARLRYSADRPASPPDSLADSTTEEEVTTFASRRRRESPEPHVKWIPRLRYVVLRAMDTDAGVADTARLLFGKHKGETLDEIAEIDPTYLSWIKEAGLGREDPVWVKLVDCACTAGRLRAGSRWVEEEV